MMNVSFSTGRAALRLSRSSFRHLCASRVAGFAYHSYPLPSKIPEPPTSGNLSKSSLAQPEALPRVHETRPPPQHDAVPKPMAPPQVEAQSPSPTTSSVPPPSPKTAETDAPKTQPAPTARPRSKLRARKAAMKLTPAAVEQLRALLNQPDPKLIKVGVRNRGCSGLAYQLEYVDKPGAFDELVEQDGVKVLIDSKALFSIIGSEMDWAEDKLSQKFVFKNPNIKEQCGCGESFMV
ncbi:Iron-sulfur cluster assembly accessory protein Isa1 [Trichoderma simmonsii]|uniref:Iron-sulfur assembly protein 1 n=1 Tax=Trichoderma simmonsii TaxID=1491479 RepID=A0A8G0PCG1_9HYPO|nr:Iron-sulfur cluster assembly accessory protein Isa1 [Trichoderma simmonsii]